MGMSSHQRVILFIQYRIYRIKKSNCRDRKKNEKNIYTKTGNVRLRRLAGNRLASLDHDRYVWFFGEPQHPPVDLFLKKATTVQLCAPIGPELFHRRLSARCSHLVAE